MPLALLRKANEAMNPFQKCLAYPGIASLALGGALGASAGVGIPCILILPLIATYAYTKQSKQNTKWKKAVVASAVLPLSFLINGISVVIGASATGKQLPETPKTVKAESAPDIIPKQKKTIQTEKLSDSDKTSTSKNRQEKKDSTPKPSTEKSNTKKEQVIQVNKKQETTEKTPSKDEMISALKDKGLRDKLPFMCTFSTSCVSKHHSLLIALTPSNTSTAIRQAIAKAKSNGVDRPEFVSFFESEAKKRRAQEEEAERAKREMDRLKAIEDGTYMPNEFEVGGPCKELAKQNSLTQRVDWGWLGNANAKWYPSLKTIILQGKTQNAFGVKIPFTIDANGKREELLG